MGSAFPLFTEQMFTKLTYHWGVTLFACIGLVMIPLPFVSQSSFITLKRALTRRRIDLMYWCRLQILLWKGPAIRARSKFASQVMHKQ